MINEKSGPRVGVGVVVFKGNRILLGKRKGAHGEGDWSFPGGHPEFGEDVEDCAKRELAEETGLKAVSLQPGPWVNDIIEDSKHYITLFVFVNEFEGEPQLLEPNKCEGWVWFECNALPNPLFPPVKSMIKKIGLEKLIFIALGKEYDAK